MPINSGAEILRARRPSDWDSYPPSATQPAFDPIMMIAGLLGPGIARGLMGGVSRGAASAAPKPAPQFSQADMLMARMRSGAQQQMPWMKAQRLAAPARSFVRTSQAASPMQSFETPTSGFPGPVGMMGDADEFAAMLSKSPEWLRKNVMGDSRFPEINVMRMATHGMKPDSIPPSVGISILQRIRQALSN